MRSQHKYTQTNLELWDHIKTTLFDDFRKLVKKSIDVSSVKRNLKLLMKWLVYAILSFASQYFWIESDCSLTKNFEFLNLQRLKIKISEM